MDTLTRWAVQLRADAYSPRTVAHRVTVMRCMARAAGIDAGLLTRDHVAAYLAAEDYRPRTRQNYLTTAALFGRWAGLGDLTEGIRQPRIPRSVPRPVSEAGLARMLLAAAPGSREHAWIVLGAYAGCRSAESAAVRAGDLEESGAGWALRIVGKAGVERLVPVPVVVVEVLRAAATRVGGRGFLWPSASPRAVQAAVRAVAAAAGVRCSSHQLRHRYGTAVYRASKDLLLTQQLMGHASPATTAGYALVVIDEGAAVVARLPGAGRAVEGMG